MDLVAYEMVSIEVYEVQGFQMGFQNDIKEHSIKDYMEAYELGSDVAPVKDVVLVQKKEVEH